MTTLSTMKSNLEELENDLSCLVAKFEDKEKERDFFELDADDFIESYEEMLDEIHGEFMNMNASRILKECDPIAYRCGLSDYVDSLEISDSEGYKELDQECDDITDCIEEKEEEIEELEQEIDDLESEEG